MRLELVDNLGRFEELGDDWDDLDPGDCPWGPMFTHDWFVSWLSAFRDSGRLSILTLFDGETLVGAAPTQIVKAAYRRVPCRQLRPLLNRHVPGCSCLLRNGYESEARRLMDGLLSMTDWDIVWFDNIVSGSHLYRVCSELSASTDHATVMRKSMSSPVLKFTGTWRPFFASRPRNARRSLLRNERLARNAGEVTLIHTTQSEESLALMPTLIAIGENSWKAPAGRAIGSQEESRRFYATLAERFGRSGDVGIWLLQVDGEPAAFEFHLKRGGHVQALRAEFDERFRPLGVGSVLDMSIIKSLFETGTREYHMGGSPDSYKKRWTNDVLDHYEFLLFGRTDRGRILHALETRIVPRLKRVLNRRVPE